jgi:putative transposase
LTILNYTVTSNHIHLLVADDKDRDVIPSSIKLIAGRTGQEFNQRKTRKGAFWEDRYHSTAIEYGEHLMQCLIYIDLNMVRAGVVLHPAEWSSSGYNEIQEPKRKNVLIDYEKLRELLGFETYDRVKTAHKKWVDGFLKNGENFREEKWTSSIAVGSEGFVGDIKALMSSMASGRRHMGAGESFQLRETQRPKAIFSGLKRER